MVDAPGFVQVTIAHPLINEPIINQQHLAHMIRKLPQQVINQIAAGEVIQRPANVIKELVENSIDAGSTAITLTIAHGGMKIIKIIDNGSGIMAKDFPLLCTRFATSKIKDFSDMQSLGSFGFRGEALASLSYCSKLTITSRWKQDKLGHCATFRNEEIEGKETEVAMNSGTRITAQDLFFNAETRRQSLSPSEEKRKIIKLISHFALHYPNIKFSLQSEKGNQNLPQSTAHSPEEAQMQIFQKISKLSYDKFTFLSAAKLNHMCSVEGIISKINSCKGKTLMLNINHRIVENQQILRAVERAYSECYQSIHEEVESFLVYLSITIDPKQIDCNVHPTKKSVGFFAATEIYASLYETILNKIKEDSSIKIIRPSAAQRNITFSSVMGRADHKVQNDGSKQSVYAYNKNRTDSKQMPLAFFCSQKMSHDSGEGKERKLKYRFQEYERDLQMRKFFSDCTYVGCFGLRYIMVHTDNKLYMLDILPFLPSFLVSHSINNSFSIKQIEPFGIGPLLENFIQETKILPDHQQVLEWVGKRENQEYLAERFGVETDGGNVQAYPCACDLFNREINIDERMKKQVGYLVCRAYYAMEVSGMSRQKEDKMVMDFLTSQFDESRSEISPFNDAISAFFQNRVVPTLKTLPARRRESRVQPKLHMKQMLDLKDVYKIFERC